MIQPPNLKPGDTIGIVCPAGAIDIKIVQNCMETLQKWGYKVRLGVTVEAKHHSFAGTDSERAADLQKMLNDPSVNAILCGRGGYGVSRIINEIDFTIFNKHPKWVVGFSDITVLHAAIQKQNCMSIHGPMAAAFGKGVAGEIFTDSLKALLEGRTMELAAKPHALNTQGKAVGNLIGGNLCLVAHLVGSKYAFDTKGKILFLEDVGEYHYNLDRLMIQIKNAGLLEGLAGLVIGGFTDMKDMPTDFGATAFEIIAAHTAEYAYPICFNFPISHDLNNFAVKEGGRYELQINDDLVALKEV
jgi:muramoyltetrapeptide carboxypeptidase